MTLSDTMYGPFSTEYVASLEAIKGKPLKARLITNSMGAVKGLLMFSGCKSAYLPCNYLEGVEFKRSIQSSKFLVRGNDYDRARIVLAKFRTMLITGRLPEPN